MPMKTLAALLKSAFKRKKASHPGYSLRALARDLGVSPAFVSNILAGKKMPPKDRLEQLSYCLELDLLEREQLVKYVRLDGFSVKVLGKRPQRDKNLKVRRTSEASNEHVLSSWMNLAVLEGLTLKEPYNDLSALRLRLGISVAELKRALANLHAAGVIEERDGQWCKKDETT